MTPNLFNQNSHELVVPIPPEHLLYDQYTRTSAIDQWNCGDSNEDQSNHPIT